MLHSVNGGRDQFIEFTCQEWFSWNTKISDYKPYVMFSTLMSPRIKFCGRSYGGKSVAVFERFGTEFHGARVPKTLHFWRATATVLRNLPPP